MSAGTDTPQRWGDLRRLLTETGRQYAWRYALAFVLLAHAVSSAVQVLVLNPMAALPGRPLWQIYEGVTARGESMSVPTVVAALALPLVLGVAVLAQTARSSLSRETSTGLLSASGLRNMVMILRLAGLREFKFWMR